MRDVGDEEGPICSTCGLQATSGNGVRITDLRKYLTAPIPCPECMEAMRAAMRLLADKWAKRAVDAVMEELGR
jgi:hypothetical protein